MPRKNQRRKNANSQSGRRKAKPIKFNPNDIENEQKLLCATIEEDAVDVQKFEQETQQYQDEEMESSYGSAAHRNDNDDYDDDDDDDDDDKSNNQIISNSESDGNEIDPTNQTDKTDDVQKDASITIPVAYTDSNANNEVDELMAMSQTESHEMSTANLNTDINSESTTFDESNSNAENKANSVDQSLIITTTTTTFTMPESTNAYVVDNDINRNSDSGSVSSGNRIDASCDIIVSVPTTDALQTLDGCATAENMIHTLDNSIDTEIKVTALANFHPNDTDAGHSSNDLTDDNTNTVCDTNLANMYNTKESIVNYAQINQSNAKAEDQTASMHVPLDQNNPNNSTIGIETENAQYSQQQQSPPQQQQHNENSDNLMKETQSNCVDNSSGAYQEQPQINQTKVDFEDRNRTSTIKAQATETTSVENRYDASPVVKEVSSKQTYRVESPEPNKSALNAPTMIKKSRSLNDCGEFGIQEMSDAGSSAAENDDTPLVSEAESESDTVEHKIPKPQFPNRLISVETFPMDYQEDQVNQENQKYKESVGVSLCPEVEQELRNCIAEQLVEQETQQVPQSPPMAKRQKRPPLPPPPPASAQFLNPINNYLQAISEENSDASDIEQHKCDDMDVEKTNDSKPNKSDAIYPKSYFDFSRVSRHTNLVAPSTEAIREEMPCILVDTKIIDPNAVTETAQPWTTTVADHQSHAEVVYLDSSSSNTSLSDIESASGIDGDVEDLNSESEVRIETPTIGSNSFSAFTSIAKKPSDDNLSELKRILNASASLDTNPRTANNIGLCTDFNKDKKSFLNIEFNKVPNPSPIDHSFKPINDHQCSIRTLLENIAAASTESLTDDKENDICDMQMPFCDNSMAFDAQNIENEETKQSVHTDYVNETQINTIQSQSTSQIIHDQQNDTLHDQLESPMFKIGEICSNSMFRVAGTGTENPNSNPNPNLLDSNTINNNQELIRQDSASSHSSSHTTSTSHSQCTAKYLASQTSPNEFGDSIENTNVKTLHQLSIERIVSLPYGDLILDELAKSSQQLIDPNMPYPPPKLPRIEDLEIHSNLLQQPRPPPRANQSRIKFLPNYKLKLSPSPPPVPQRPWLGVPTAENPNVLVCLSPAQREFYKENTAPDHLLDLHNKFVDRRGYHEFTDDEIMAINFRESLAKSSSSPPLKQTAEREMSNMKTKDDNRLLALIREINQLTNTNDSSALTAEKQTTLPTNRSAQSPAQQQSDQTTLKMSRSASGPNQFNNKRFSNYFDELSRLHPIVEETPKVYTNVETTNHQSRKRTENGQTVYEYSDSNHEKSSNVQSNRETAADKNAFNNNRPFDVNIDKVFGSGEALGVNQIENSRYCKYAECKNSRSDDSVHHRTSEKANDDESLKKHSTDTSDSDPNRFSFKEFDFVPKVFSNFIRANKTDAPCGGSAVITQESSETTVQTNTENYNVTNRCEIRNSNRNSVSPLPLKKSERYSSTHSLYDWFSEGREAGPESPHSISRNNLSSLNVRGVPIRGRISPNPVRAPRINDPPKPSSTPTVTQQSQRHYDWQATKQSRTFENRQSMIDQTPITRHVTSNPRRLSLPKAMADDQLAYILEKERQISVEFDKLEQDRLRLLQELEEMQVNQNFEDNFKEHKKRNSMLPNMGHFSEEELLKKRMQDEWLNKVAEREERRLQKIIKVTHSTCELAPSYTSLTNRGLGDEFLDRVKERRSKLQIPADSDWDSGAESQPIKREQISPNIDPTVKVIDDGREADIKSLPRHLKEFAEFTTKCESSESKIECDTNATSTMKTESKEIIHKIERCDKEDGESSNAMSVHLTLIGLCVAISLLCWSYNRLYKI